MSTALAPLARQVAERALNDSSFAEVLDALLDAPTGPQGTLERVAASSLNDERRGALVREFVEGSLPTPEVQERLDLHSPQAVHRLRSRGKLLGSAVGNQTWFPAWQFDADRVRTDRAQTDRVARTTDPVWSPRWPREPRNLAKANINFRASNSGVGPLTSGLGAAPCGRRPPRAREAWEGLGGPGP